MGWVYVLAAVLISNIPYALYTHDWNAAVKSGSSIVFAMCAGFVFMRNSVPCDREGVR